MSVLLPLNLLLPPPAEAKRPEEPAFARVRVSSIEEVVAAERFTPTPSQSEIYKAGAVLVSSGHDVVVSRCIDAEPDIAIMSQASVATSAGIEKRLSFVGPERRIISLGRLHSAEACCTYVQRPSRSSPRQSFSTTCWWPSSGIESGPWTLWRGVWSRSAKGKPRPTQTECGRAKARARREHRRSFVATLQELDE